MIQIIVLITEAVMPQPLQSALPVSGNTPPVKILNKGETLFRQGDAARNIYAVTRGRIRLIRHLDDGGTVTLHIARAGESFAEAALFSDVYHCDAVADEASQVTIHAKDALLKTFKSDKHAATGFMARLARQVMGLRSRLELRNIRSARDRVMQFLLLSREDGSDSVSFDRPLREVAGEIGLSHEAFYRTLAGLEKNGRIERNGRIVRILSGV